MQEKYGGVLDMLKGLFGKDPQVGQQGLLKLDEFNNALSMLQSSIMGLPQVMQPQLKAAVSQFLQAFMAAGTQYYQQMAQKQQPAAPNAVPQPQMQQQANKYEHWVLANCKFAKALIKQAGILDFMGEDDLNAMIGDPSKAARILLNAYMKRGQLGGDFGEISAADISGDLAAVDARLFPGQGPRLNNAMNVNAVLRLLKQVVPPMATQPGRQPAVPSMMTQPGRRPAVPSIATQPGRRGNDEDASSLLVPR